MYYASSGDEQFIPAPKLPMEADVESILQVEVGGPPQIEDALVGLPASGPVEQWVEAQAEFREELLSIELEATVALTDEAEHGSQALSQKKTHKARETSKMEAASETMSRVVSAETTPTERKRKAIAIAVNRDGPSEWEFNDAPSPKKKQRRSAPSGADKDTKPDMLPQTRITVASDAVMLCD